jgi:hypothetical protein
MMREKDEARVKMERKVAEIPRKAVGILRMKLSCVSPDSMKFKKSLTQIARRYSGLKFATSSLRLNAVFISDDYASFFL